jgi:hypothetical protein
MNAFALRNDTKIVAADQKRLAADGKNVATMQNAFLRTFSHIVSNAKRCKTLQTQSSRTYRSAKAYKRSRCGLIAVQNDTNAVVADLSQCQMIQKGQQRTFASPKV